METITSRDLVGYLDAVPEKQLRIVDLACELTRPDGALDVDMAIARKTEVDLAVNEIDGYLTLCNVMLKEVLKCL